MAYARCGRAAAGRRAVGDPAGPALYAVLGSSRLLSVGPGVDDRADDRRRRGRRSPAGDPGRYAALAAALARRRPGCSACSPGPCGSGSSPTCCPRPVLVGYLAGVALHHDGRPAATSSPACGSTGGVLPAAGLLRPPASTRSTCRPSSSPPSLLVAAPRRVPASSPRLPAPAARGRSSPPSPSRCFGLDDRCGIVGDRRRPLRPAEPRLPTLGDARRAGLPALGVLLVGYTDIILTARAFAARATAPDSTPTRSSSPWGRPTSAPALAARLPGQQQRQPHGPRRRPRAAAPRLYSLVALVAVVLVAALPAPRCWPTSPSAVLGALVVYAAIRLIDVAEFRRLAALPAQRTAAGAGDARRCPGPGHPVRGAASPSASRSPTCCAGWPGRTTRVLGFVPGLAGMHDVDDYPTARHDSRAGGLPLRLAAVLRQRGELPPPRPGRGRRRRRPGPSGSSSTPRPTSRSTSPRLDAVATAAPRTGRARHRLRARPGEAGPPRRPQGVRPRRRDRHRTGSSPPCRPPSPRTARGTRKARHAEPVRDGAPTPPSPPEPTRPSRSVCGPTSTAGPQVSNSRPIRREAPTMPTAPRTARYAAWPSSDQPTSRASARVRARPPGRAASRRRPTAATAG